MGLKAKPWERRTKPMPAARAELSYGRVFTKAEVERLGRGLIPQRMEDKWFGSLRSNALDFYRSWTGFHIYRLQTCEGGGRLEAGPLIVNDEPTQHRRRGEGFDVEMIDRLIERMLAVEPDA